jgi:hypothetical protein
MFSQLASPERLPRILGVSDLQTAMDRLRRDLIFDEYLKLLEQFGLRAFFEPVDRRVTLSTHAAANKPDRRVFEKAIARLGVSAALTDCLFITENVSHRRARSSGWRRCASPLRKDSQIGRTRHRSWQRNFPVRRRRTGLETQRALQRSSGAAQFSPGNNAMAKASAFPS